MRLFCLTRSRFIVPCLCVCLCKTAAGELTVSALGKTFNPTDNELIRQTSADMGGSTSIRNNTRAALVFKSSGYFQRNRDLGQVFGAPRSGRISGLVLRTGNSDAAVLDGAIGQEIFVQWFDVIGTPTINDNGTPRGTEAKHGFSKNHRCDDFVEGVAYTSIKVVRGGRFPKLPPTRNVEGEPTGDDSAKLVYLKFEFDASDQIEVVAGQRYAFLVGLVQPAAQAGFTLANSNRAASSAAVPQDLTSESSVGGWGIRREGNGQAKPTLISELEPEVGTPQRAQMLGESMLPPVGERFAVSPQTDGYPDVDTYRDLEFYLTLAEPTLR